MKPLRPPQSLGIVAVLVLMLMASLSIVRAGNTLGVEFDVVGEPSVDCGGEAILTVAMYGNSSSVGTTLKIGANTYGSTPGSISVSTYAEQTFTFSFPKQSGTVVFEFYGNDYGNEATPQLLAAVTVDCDKSETKSSDGRFCFAPGEAKAAVYGFKDGENYGVEIWAIDENSKGQRVIRMTASEIDKKTVKGQRTLLNSSIFNSVKLYRLEDGRFQINVGPVGERKVHVCVFNTIPPTAIEKYTLSY